MLSPDVPSVAGVVHSPYAGLHDLADPSRPAYAPATAPTGSGSVFTAAGEENGGLRAGPSVGSKRTVLTERPVGAGAGTDFPFGAMPAAATNTLGAFMTQPCGAQGAAGFDFSGKTSSAFASVVAAEDPHASASAPPSLGTPIRKRHRRRDFETPQAVASPPQLARHQSAPKARVDDSDAELKARRAARRTADGGVSPPSSTRVGHGLQRVEVSGTVFQVSEKYKVEKAVGHGSYGVVVSAEDTTTGKKVAIKKVPNLFCDLDCATRVLREIKVVNNLRHDNVLAAIDLEPPVRGKLVDAYIVTELMETDMHRVIYSRQRLSDEHIQYFMYQTVCALKFMHSAKVIHRDIKPSNILLNADCKLRLCDFGFARSNLDKDSTMTEYVVTRWYRAPEIMLASQRYTSAVDIWSLGCVFAELLGSRPLFPGEDYVDQLRLITSALGTPSEDDMTFITSDLARNFMKKQSHKPGVTFRTLFPDANALALDLLEKMLCFHPDKRITAAEALSHPYIAGFRGTGDEREADTVFTFNFEEEDLTHATLKAHYLEEIAKFHPEVVRR